MQLDKQKLKYIKQLLNPNDLYQIIAFRDIIKTCAEGRLLCNGY